MNTALASHGFSAWRSILCKTYLTKVLMMIVSKMAYSKPNTSCTDAPVILHYLTLQMTYKYLLNQNTEEV